MKKIDYENMSEKELAQTIKSLSINPSYSMLVSKIINRTNQKSKTPGGSVVVLVDHNLKREMAYPNIKSVSFYVDTLMNNYVASENYCRSVDEIYYITANNDIKKYVHHNKIAL